jgi:hypothetical protein
LGNLGEVNIQNPFGVCYLLQGAMVGNLCNTNINGNPDMFLSITHLDIADAIAMAVASFPLGGLGRIPAQII